MERSRTIQYVSRFEEPQEFVWAALADTERLNQAAGTPFTPYVAEEIAGADGLVERHAHRSFGPFTLRWREGFGQWVENRHIRQVRYFERGPIRKLGIDVRLEPDGSGTIACYEFFASWSSWLGDLMARAGALGLITRPVVDTFEGIVAEARRSGSPRAGFPAPALAPTARSRLDAALAQIEAGPYGHGLARRLAEMLTGANPLDLRRLRPLALAVEWQVPPEAAIELFVAAHAAGLVSMRWEINCPRCRGGKGESGNLAALPGEVHCSSCNIDYTRDFENNVELVFRPEPWVRTLPEGQYCMMGPLSTPHVKLQCDVAPGEQRMEALTLAPGRYRLRTVEPGPATDLDHPGGPVPEIVVTPDAIETGAPAPEGQLAMRNLDHHLHSIVVEAAAWGELSLTGPRVIAAQAFRDLCPEQLLRPGDEVSIGHVAILFSDLKGSTALYEEIGDSRAYVLVREHFDFLAECVRRSRGAVVKTIGDAVMAVFPDGPDALAAAIAIQSGVAGFNRDHSGDGIVLKIGVHQGRCIAVTAGGVLDYFGSTVNMAARLQGACRGGEIVLSPQVHADPGATDLLAGRSTVRESLMLPGFAQPASCYRISGF